MPAIWVFIIIAFIIIFVEVANLLLFRKESKCNKQKYYDLGFDDGYNIGYKIGSSRILEDDMNIENNAGGSE